MTLDENEKQDSLMDESANTAKSLHDGYKNAKDLYNKGKDLKDRLQNASNSPAQNSAGEALNEKAGDAVQKGAGDAMKNSAENSAKEVAKKAGEETAKATAENALTTAGVASGAVSFGIGTAITLGVKAVKKTVDTVKETIGEKDSSGIGIIVGIIVVILIALFGVFLVLLTPTMILVSIISFIMSLLSEIGADSWVELGYQLGIVEEEERDAYYVEEIIDEYDIHDAENNAVSVQTAVVLDLSKTLIKETYNDIKASVSLKCDTPDDNGNKYNYYMSIDTLASFEALYGDVNYAEIACIASQSRKYADAVSYTEFQEHTKDKRKRERLIVYESEPAYVTLKVTEYINMHLLDYDGIIALNGDTCVITYTKYENDAWRSQCCISNCHAEGYQYIFNHSVEHSEEEETTTSGYYCDNHVPTPITHASNGVSATTDDLERDMKNYKNPPYSEVKAKLDEMYSYSEQEITDEIRYGSYIQVEEGVYVSTSCYDLDFEGISNLTPPKTDEEENNRSTGESTEEAEEEAEEVEMGIVIDTGMLQSAIDAYKTEIGNKQYTMQYLEITAYPYSLQEMYAFFAISSLASNTTYPTMKNYQVLDAREKWLRTYADDIEDELGSDVRSPLKNAYKYTGDLTTGDIFMDDILLTESEVRINLPSYYNQGDSKWASLPFWIDSTIKKEGCCLCAMAMIADYFTPDEEVTPITLQSYGSPIMDTELKFYRSGVTEVYDFDLMKELNYFDSEECMVQLKQGNLVLVRYYAGSEFTKSGHFAVIYGYKYNENGEAIFLTYDSGSKSRTESGVTFAQVEFNADAMWAYGKGSWIINGFNTSWDKSTNQTTDAFNEGGN